jgi:dTMP kinase
MNVYFLGTFSGGRKSTPDYKKIVEEIEKLGHVVLSKQIADVGLEVAGENRTSTYIYNRERQRIEEADAIVAEVSTPGIGVGYFINHSLTLGKPVLVLNTNGVNKRASVVLEGNPFANLYLEHYEPKTVSIVLKKFFEHLKLEKEAKFKGKFIVFEGTDGVGKTTQYDMLLEYLTTNGFEVKSIKFPRYEQTFYGNMVRRYLNGEFGNQHTVNPYMITMFYAMDRVQSKDEIYESLRSGEYVLADRYTWSNMAFRSASIREKDRDSFVDWIEEAEYNINKIPKEDFTVLLYAPVEFIWKNMEKKRKGRDYTTTKRDIHEIDKKYLKEVAKQYLALAKRNSEKCVVINCVKNNKLKPAETIHFEIIDALRKRGLI